MLSFVPPPPVQRAKAKVANDLMSAGEIRLLTRDDGCNSHMWSCDRLPLLTVAPVNHVHAKISPNQGIPDAQMSTSHTTMYLSLEHGNRCGAIDAFFFYGTIKLVSLMHPKICFGSPKHIMLSDIRIGQMPPLLTRRCLCLSPLLPPPFVQLFPARVLVCSELQSGSRSSIQNQMRV